MRWNVNCRWWVTGSVLHFNLVRAEIQYRKIQLQRTLERPQGQSVWGVISPAWPQTHSKHPLKPQCLKSAVFQVLPSLKIFKSLFCWITTSQSYQSLPNNGRTSGDALKNCHCPWNNDCRNKGYVFAFMSEAQLRFPKNKNKTRIISAPDFPLKTVTHRPDIYCTMSLSRQGWGEENSAGGATVAGPPHTESLRGTSLKWLCMFTEHFHLCSTTFSPLHTCFSHQWIFITTPFQVPSLDSPHKWDLRDVWMESFTSDMTLSPSAPCFQLLLLSDDRHVQCASVLPTRWHKGYIWIGLYSSLSTERTPQQMVLLC